MFCWVESHPTEEMIIIINNNNDVNTHICEDSRPFVWQMSLHVRWGQQVTGETDRKEKC